MNKSNKVKVILFATIGCIVVAIILVVFFAINKESGSAASGSKNDTISVSNNDKFTYQDMMSLNETKQEEYAYEPAKTTQTQIPDETIVEGQSVSEAPAGGSTSQPEVRMKQIAARINQPQPSQEEEKPQEVNTPKSVNRVPKTVVISPSRKIVANEEPEDEPEAPAKRKLFFDSDNEEIKVSGATTITAVIHGDQLVDNNSSVKFHTTNDSRINGTIIPRNTVFYGVASNATSRMRINVTSISGISVNFQVYDQGDGMEGLRIARQTNASEKNNGIDEVQNDALSTAGLYSVPVVGGLTRAASNLLRSRRTNTTVVLSTNYKVSVR